MTERFPEQRNRSAQRRADASEVFDRALPVFDESFVAAAVIHEPSADARSWLAQTQESGSGAEAQLPQQRSQTRPVQLPLPHWTVRPAHHLSALRMSAVTAIACVMAVTALIFMLLR
jgi:hypothetical protein